MSDKPAEKQPEKVDDAKVSATQRGAEQIIGHLNEYLSIRYDHASRINPNLKHMKLDLMYHEMSNVRRTLLSEKIYGPVKQVVTDVFLGDDDDKRRKLMSPSDQTSVQVELVSHCQDDKVEATRGQIRFHDLKSYYSAIDPNLNNFIDLFETWIWWDLLDSVELARFEQKFSRMQTVRQGRLSDESRKRYSTIIHPPKEGEPQAAQATDDEVLRYEFAKMAQIREQWKFRHGGELGYKFVLKRDEEAPANGDEEPRLGAPYNYKERQLAHIERALAELRAQLGGVIKDCEAKPAGQASAAQPSAGAAKPPAPAAAAAAPGLDARPAAMPAPATVGASAGAGSMELPPIDPKLGF